MIRSRSHLLVLIAVLNGCSGSPATQSPLTAGVYHSESEKVSGFFCTTSGAFELPNCNVIPEFSAPFDIITISLAGLPLIPTRSPQGPVELDVGVVIGGTDVDDKKIVITDIRFTTSQLAIDALVFDALWDGTWTWTLRELPNGDLFSEARSGMTATIRDGPEVQVIGGPVDVTFVLEATGTFVLVPDNFQQTQNDVPGYDYLPPF